MTWGTLLNNQDDSWKARKVCQVVDPEQKTWRLWILKRKIKKPQIQCIWLWCTLPETNIAHENPSFPGKYHQNGGFSMGMLVYRSVNLYTGWWFDNIFFLFSSRSLGKWSNLTCIFFRWFETTNLYIYIWMFPKIGVGPQNGWWK